MQCFDRCVILKTDLKKFLRKNETLKKAKQEKHIFLYLLAFFFFINGVYTIIDMATAYGTALGLDTTGLQLQNENLAVGALVVLFIIGCAIFCKSDKLSKERVGV